MAVESGLKLERCPNPWCGSSTAPVPVGTRAGRWRIMCACGVTSFSEPTRDEAASAWNTRTRAPSDAALVEALELAVAVLEEADMRLDYAPDSLGALEMEDALAKGYAALAAAKGQQP